MAVLAAGRAGSLFGGIGLGGALVLGAGIAAAVYLISAPLLMLLTAAFRGPTTLLPFEPGALWTLDNLAAVYSSAALYRKIIPDTVVFVAGAVAVAFVIAFILAWLVERTDLPGRHFFFTLILFPILVPTVILAIAWIFMFGPNAGWVNVALRAAFGLDGSGPLNLFSMPGLIVAQGAASVPFVFLLLSATLRSMNPALEEASAASGASPLTTFRRVTLPVLRPGILAPLILSTLVTLEQFELPLIIGLPARISVFSIQIYFELNPDTDIPAYGRAAAVSLPFLAAGLALLLVYNRLVRQSERYVTVTGKGYRPARIALGRWRWPAVAFAGAYVLFAAVLPAAVLMWVSVFGYASPSLAALPNLSFKAYAELFRDPRFHLAVGNTFVAAGVSAFVVTTIGALVAWTVVRTRWRGRFVLDFVSFVSIGIPSVIAGLACLLLYLTVPIGVYGTVWVLVLAYSYRLAVTTRLARAGLMQLHAELEEASYASGGGWLATLRRVVAPLMAPALVSGFLLLFIVGFREFTIGLIMLSDDNIVLSVILWRLFETSRPMHAAAVATLIVLFVVPVIFLARRALLTGREPA